jgi:protocatechuate 3,4-dioxygenase beta subunit
VLKDIPKGRYVLSASKSGFLSQEYGRSQPNRSGAVLDLATAQTLRDVTFRMTAGAVIAGRAYDQNGQPVEGILIRAFRRSYQSDGKAVLSAVGGTVTNDIGEYRIYWLPPGTYYIHSEVSPARRASANPVHEPAIIDQSEGPSDVFVPSFYPNGDDESHATPLRIEAGSERRAIDFTLTRTPALRVSGRVVGEASGLPVGDATLEMRPDVGALPINLIPVVHTDDAGRFEFRNLSPGKYILSARWTEPGFRSMFTEQHLHIGNKDVLDLQIVLRANRSISGRLMMERGEPLPQNRTVLSFTDAKGASYGTGLQADGTFLLSNIPSAILQVQLTEFPENYFIRSARAGSTDVLEGGLNLTENSVDSLEVIVASQGATVEGVVTDERQSPVVGAHVVVIPNAQRLQRSHLVKAVTTDQYGRFAIRGVMPGDYKIFGWEDLEPNIFFDPSFMEQYESQGKALHLDDDSLVKVALKMIPLQPN